MIDKQTMANLSSKHRRPSYKNTFKYVLEEIKIAAAAGQRHVKITFAENYKNREEVLSDVEKKLLKRNFRVGDWTEMSDLVLQIWW